MSTASTRRLARWLRSLRQDPARRHRPVCRFELLENRSLLTGNLWITGAHLVDSGDHPVAAPAIGEMVFVEADWETTGLSSSDQYLVRFSLDGVALDSATITGQAGTNLPYYWYLGGWYSKSGPHSVQVTVDGTSAVAETNESDNTATFSFSPVAPTSLPMKFVTPLGGVPNRDWSIVNYVDLDPTAGVRDYNGGHYTYNGHTGIDMTLANFAEMDAGVPVYAAADGTVSAIVDGNYDRNTDFSNPNANYLIIDDGNAWQTIYYHFRKDSITVVPGEKVFAGEALGFAGSSGNSTDAHLHFEVHHNGDVVETYLDATAYWVKPLPYSGTQHGILDCGITDHNPSNQEFHDRPSEVDALAPGQVVYFWNRLHGVHAGDTLTFHFFDPNGVDLFAPSWSAPEITYGIWYASMGLSSSATAGTYRAEFDQNGVQISQRFFKVGLPASPAIEVSERGTTSSDIVSGSLTPVDFGKWFPDRDAPTRTLTVRNTGAATLHISSVTVPSGFTVLKALAPSLAPGQADTLTIRLNSGVSGTKKGNVTILSDDPAIGSYLIPIKGVGYAPGQLLLYTDTTYLGTKTTLKFSNFAKLLLNLPLAANDTTSSLKFTAPAGWEVRLYRDVDGGGPYLSYVSKGKTITVSDVGTTWNDSISSARLIPPVEAWVDSRSGLNLTGTETPEAFTGGDAGPRDLIGAANNAARSLRYFAPQGWEIRLYDGAGGTGSFLTILGDGRVHVIDSLATVFGAFWDAAISSIVIVRH